MTGKVGGDAYCDTFFDQALLTGLMAELVKLLVHGAGTFTSPFDGANMMGIAAKLAFMEARGRWGARIYGCLFDQADMDEMRAMPAKLP